MLPKSFGSLPILKYLDLSSNSLVSVSGILGRFTALERLFLSNNLLETLPESLGALRALKSLILHNNPLVALPNSFGSLASTLEMLSLYGTQLYTLPELLQNFAKLKFLNLSVLRPSWLGSEIDFGLFITLPESLRGLLIQTGNLGWLPLLAPEKPLTIELLLNKFALFTHPKKQCKSCFEKIHALDLPQLEKLSAAIKKKMLGEALNEDDKQILAAVFTIDREYSTPFLLHCVREHGNLFLSEQTPSIQFRGEQFESYRVLALYMLNNVLDVFYQSIKNQIDSQSLYMLDNILAVQDQPIKDQIDSPLPALEPIPESILDSILDSIPEPLPESIPQSTPVKPKRKKQNVAKQPSASCAKSAHSGGKMARSSKRHPMSLDERRFKKPRVYTPMAIAEGSEGSLGTPWLTLQRMVAVVEKSFFSGDKDSMNGLREVSDFLNNPQNVNHFEGLRAILTPHQEIEGQMGPGAALRQFKEPEVSVLYRDLHRALPDEALLGEKNRKKPK